MVPPHRAGLAAPAPLVISYCCLVGLLRCSRLIQGYALFPGANLHIFLMLRLEALLLLRIRLDQPQLLAILVLLLDAHEFVAVDTLAAIPGVVRGVRTILNLIAFLGGIMALGGIMNSITISHAIPIHIRLAALDLGAMVWLMCPTILALSVSLREPGQWRQRHCGDD